MNLKGIAARILDWVPFGFCVFLCYSELWMRSRNGLNAFSEIVFLAFLPMCFLFLGNVISQYRKRIVDLESRIAQLEGASKREA